MADENTAPSPTGHRVYKVKTMNNGNLVSLCEQMDRVVVEELLSNSAFTPDFRKADKERLETYFRSWEKLANFMVKDPELDSPQTAPEKIPVQWISNKTEIVDEDGEVQTINHYPENNAIRTITRDIRTLMGEMALSVSRRLPNGMMVADKKRFDMHLSKLRSFMAEYVEEVEPLDRPETDTYSSESGHGFL